MKITQLTAENIKRLQAVQITPSGSIVQITGRNGQGKSSVLDSIAYALGGKDAICAKPVRSGEKKARVICRLDDLVVTRTFTEDGGGSLTVANAEGARFPSPQAILDKMVGKLTLDPLAFSRMPAKQQLDTLKSLVGLDFSAFDKERAEAYAERTNVNRSLSALTPQIDAMPVHVGVPSAEVSVSTLVQEFSRRQKVNAENATLRRRAAELEASVATYSQAMTAAASASKSIAEKLSTDLQAADDELEREIARMRERYGRLRAGIKDAAKVASDRALAKWEQCQRDHEKAEHLLSEMKDKLSGLVDLDAEEVSSQLASAEATNQKVRDNQRRIALEAQAELLAEKSNELTERIELIDNSKRQKLASAAFPIPDLSFDDSGVTFKGIPFSQASAAEQLRASVAIGLAMNPKLRVLLIRDGSLLDSDGMKILAEIAAQHDAQVWIERVEDGSRVGVVIEDGHVATSPELVGADS